MVRNLFGGKLYVQVVIATVLGVALGAVWPDVGVQMKPLSDIFIRLVKMMISPIIFCTVVTGIAKSGSLRGFGRIGLKTLVYFEVLTTVALTLGLAVVNIFKPGKGLNIDPVTLDVAAVANYVTADQHQHVGDILTNIIPSNIFAAFTNGDILQIIFFAIMFGIALGQMADEAKAIVKGFEHLSAALFKIIAIIMHVAPFGAFGAMAFSIGKYGIASLQQMGFLLLNVYATCFLFIGVVLWFVARLAGFSLWRFLAYIKEEVFIVIGTSSSESVLPMLMQKLEHLGCKPAVVGLVVPTGYSFNLDGTSIYLTMAAIFMAQAMNIPLSLSEQLSLLGVLLLSSKGAAAVTGGGFVTLAATLATLHGKVPLEGLVLLLGIDRMMSEARAVTNLIGNGVATVVISAWEDALDRPRMMRVLAERFPS